MIRWLSVFCDAHRSSKFNEAESACSRLQVLKADRWPFLRSACKLYVDSVAASRCGGYALRLLFVLILASIGSPSIGTTEPVPQLTYMTRTGLDGQNNPID